MRKSRAMSAAVSWLVVLGLGAPFGSPQAWAQMVAQGHWVAAWASAQQGPEEILGIKAETFADQSIRMVVRSTIAGTRAKVLFSNELSTTPLRIGAAHIALAGKGCSAIPDSDHVLTFGGKQSIIIPPGA